MLDTQPPAGSTVLMFGNVPPPYGGLSTHLAYMIPQLVETGMRPVILLREGQDYTYWRQAGAYVYRLPSSEQDQKLEAKAYRASAPADELAYCDLIRQTLRASIEPTRFWSDLGFAKRIGKEYDVNLIHSYHAYHRSVVALVLRHIMGVPAVLTIFGEVVSELGPQLARRESLRWMLEQFDQLLATSAHCASGVELLGMRREQVAVIPYGVDTSFYKRVDTHEVRRRHQLLDKQVILFQGRISGEKGPQVLLDALPSVFKRVPHSVALFVGPDEGPSFEGSTGLADLLRTKVIDQGLEDRVVFTGGVPVEELPAYYSVADVLAFPSTSAKECMGLAMKQAMACGVPVVAARAGGAPEAIENGVTGLLCEPNDPASLAEALTDVLQSPLRDAFGRAGLRRANELFTQERTLNDTLRVYGAVMARQPASSPSQYDLDTP